jgi:hypothetical protein
MFTFIKQLFGFDKPTMKEAGVQLEQAPYKLPEPPATTPIPLVVEKSAFEDYADIALAQRPDPVATVTEVKEEPVKKARKPRAPKAVAEKPVVKKAAPVKKAAAIKAAPKKPRSKKV